MSVPQRGALSRPLAEAGSETPDAAFSSILGTLNYAVLLNLDVPQFAIVFPVLPGKREALKTFLKELSGPRFAEYDTSSKRWGFEKDTWFLQTTPQGVLVIYYGEGSDIPKAMRDWASGKDPFDVWMKQQLKDCTGIDFNQPSYAPWPEQIHKYRFDDR